MVKGIVEIDADRCKGCGLCLDVCPRHILSLADGKHNAKGYPFVTVAGSRACTGCGLCAVICPDVVFTVYRQRRRREVAAVQGTR